MWPFSHLRQPQRPDDDFIVLDESEYYVLGDSDDEAPGVRRSGVAFELPRLRLFHGRLALWSAAAGTLLLLVFVLGLITTPYRAGKPVVATPSYRKDAAEARRLDEQVRRTYAWDATVERAFSGEQDPFAAADAIRAEQKSVDALARALVLERVPARAVVYRDALENWYKDVSDYLDQLSSYLVSPHPDPGRLKDLARRWSDLKATRDQIYQAVQRLVAQYPGG